MKCLPHSSANCNLQNDNGLAVLKLSHNADPYIKRDIDGMTPLHYAIHLQSTSLVRLLINHGSNVNAQDNDGRTPLHLLADGIYEDDDVSEIATLLVENGADPTLQDKYGRTALHLAVMFENEKLVILLLEFELSNKYDKFNQLGKRNSLLHIGDKNGLTPLHYAVTYNHTQMAILLLSNGADLNAVDKYGSSALHYAAYKGHYNMIKYLRDAGGNPELADENGNTPEIFALRRNYYKTVAALQVEPAQFPKNITHIYP